MRGHDGSKATVGPAGKEGRTGRAGTGEQRAACEGGTVDNTDNP